MGYTGAKHWCGPPIDNAKFSYGFKQLFHEV